MFPTMAPAWRRKLKEELDLRGISRKELTRAVGNQRGRSKNDRLVYDLLDGTDNPRIGTLEAVAKALGKPVSWFFEDDGVSPPQVPILGAVSAGEGWMVYTDNLGELEFAPSAGDVIAVLVKGSSMVPTYRDGDVLIGIRRPGDSASKLVGMDCIIETETDERYVKYLQKSTMKGRFNLRSYNPSHKDIENVRLRWAAAIEWIKRNQR